MKKAFQLVILLLAFNLSESSSQGVWTELNGIICSQPSSQLPYLRNSGIGFGVGTGIYYGTGISSDYNYDIILRDFWEFDVVSKSWSNKPSLTNTGRENAYSFVIGNDGYVLMGKYGNTLNQDMWKYSPQSGLWSQSIAFPGAHRFAAFSFVLNNKFYLGGGVDSTLSIYYNDVWEFDPVQNSWTQKNSISGSGFFNAVSFSTAGNSYVVGGYGPSVTWRNTTLKYDQLNDLWSVVSTTPEPHLNGAFSLINTGYIFTPTHLYAYDEASNLWFPKNNLPTGFFEPEMGTANGKQYVILYNRDVWSYDPFQDLWSEEFKAPASDDLTDLNAVIINDTAYVGDKKYSILNDNWTQDSLLLGMEWKFATDSFVFGTVNGNIFMKYNPVDHTIIPTAPCSLNTIIYSFDANGLGYVYGGIYDSLFNITYQFWEYKSLNDSWVRKSDFPGSARNGAAVFSIDSNGYVVCGVDSINDPTDEVWKYNSVTDSWVQMTDYPGGNRYGQKGATFYGKGAVIFGRYLLLGPILNELQVYDPLSDSWTSISHNILRRQYQLFFGTNNGLYVGGGEFYRSQGYTYFLSDFWKYTQVPSFVDEPSIQENTSIYPNPVTDILYLKDVDKETQFIIYNGLGRKVKQGKVPMDVSDFPNGIYFVRSYSGTFSEKFMILK